MKIKLKTVMAGPRGNHGIGCILTVGKEIDEESAKQLIETNQAEVVKEGGAVKEKAKKEEKKEEAPAKVEDPVETAVEPPKEEKKDKPKKHHNRR